MGSISKIKLSNGHTSYRADIRKEGRRVTKCFPNRSLANRWVDCTEARIIEATFAPKRRTYTVGDAIERYIREVLPQKKEATEALHLAQLKARIANLKLYLLDSAELADLREELRNEWVKLEFKEPYQRQPATVNRYFVPVSHMLQTCKREWGWISEVPFVPKLRESKGRTRFLTHDEARSILVMLDRAPRKDVRLACLISLTYGSRLGETCALKWRDVDLRCRSCRPCKPCRPCVACRLYRHFDCVGAGTGWISR